MGLFPIAWLGLLLTATGDDGERLRILDVIYFGMIGVVIWLAGIIALSFVWLFDHWLVSRRR